jgi:lipid-A-disaccharide synthase
MIGAGCEPWHHVRELSVRGYVELLPQLPRLLALRRDLDRRLRSGNCSALVGVDAPDFNLALETKVRASGVPTVHYVSPSIWAWRAGRIERIRRAADRILLVFPFEQKIYEQAGIAATYVGHPLASAIPLRPDRAAARARLAALALPGLGLEAYPQSPLICLMPGSRRAEIEYILPVFLASARQLAQHLNGVRFLVPIADASLRALLQRILAARQTTAPDPDRVLLVDGHSHDCLEASDGVLVASGTATLEAALYKRPMVIVYRVPPLSAWIMRRIGGYLPWVGLPNILAGESLVPEFVQEQAKAPQIAQAMLAALEDEPGQRRLDERFCAIHESLRRDTPALATQAILQTIAQVRTQHA